MSETRMATGGVAVEIATVCAILSSQFAERIGGRSLSADTKLRDDLDLDSLDLLALAAAVEDHCGCPVLDESTTPGVFATIGSLSHHLTGLWSTVPHSDKA